MSEKKNDSYDWEGREQISRFAYDRTQEKTIFHPIEHSNNEYVVWRESFGARALKRPHDSWVFKKHGIEPNMKTRLVIEGNIDFINAAGELDVSIHISDVDDEKEYLEELLRKMKGVKELIKSRLAYLESTPAKKEGECEVGEEYE